MKFYKYKVKIKFLQDFKLGACNFQLIYGSIASLIGKDVHEIIPYSNIFGVSPIFLSRRGYAGDIRYFYVLSTIDITSYLFKLRKISIFDIKVIDVKAEIIDFNNLIQQSKTNIKPEIYNLKFPVQISSNIIKFPHIGDILFPYFYFGKKYNLFPELRTLYKSFKYVVKDKLKYYKLRIFNYERPGKNKIYQYYIGILKFNKDLLDIYSTIWIFLNALSKLLS